ncbi:hypothetical protein AtEden1_Chr5g0133771 [Arabidopsis thaliana]
MHVDNVSKNLVNNPGNMNEAFGVILRSNRKYSSIYEIKKVLGVLEQKKKTKDDQNAFLDRFVAQVLHPFKTFPCTKLRDFGLYGNVEGSKTAMNWNCGSLLETLICDYHKVQNKTKVYVEDKEQLHSPDYISHSFPDHP